MHYLSIRIHQLMAVKPILYFKHLLYIKSKNEDQNNSVDATENGLISC